MKELMLYWQFFKRNILLLLLPILIGLIISIFFYSQVATQTKISQSFRMEYSIENIDTVLALTDQAVTELRLQRFEALFPNSSVLVYKGAPLTINIETVSQDRNTGYELLLKEITYLRENFSVSELNKPAVSFTEPNAFKYFLSGILPGFLFGLATSLIREYLKNY